VLRDRPLFLWRGEHSLKKYIPAQQKQLKKILEGEPWGKN